MKSQFTLFSILLLITLSSCKNTVSNKRNTEVLLLLDSLNNDIMNFKNSTLIAGVALSLVNKDSVIFKTSYGYADLNKKTPYTNETVQPIASISKTFIGIALLKLVDLEKLDLNEDINTILPYKITNPNHPNSTILVKHLAAHTSSISDNYEINGDGYWLMQEQYYEKGDIRDDMYEFIEAISKNDSLSVDDYIQNVCIPNQRCDYKNTFTPNKPGAKYKYSNTATTIAGRIIELKSGMSLNNFCRKYIFEPLKMNNTSWLYNDVDTTILSKQYFADNQGNPKEIFEMPRFTYARYPAGHLITSNSDMNKYLIEVIKGFNGEGKILTKQSYELLLNPQLQGKHFDERYAGEFNESYNRGIFWGITSENLRMHDGGEIGVYSFMYFDPSTKMGALGMINARINSFGEFRTILRKYEKKINFINSENTEL